jgi:nicotinamide-nucleotide amidase
MTEILSSALPNDVEALVEAVLRAADARGLRLATAESCTGGLVASVLTDVEGRSHVFERGYIVCTDDAKFDELAVPPRLLGEHGAVSEPVARAMAEGALRTSGAGVALAVTGFAGPTGPDNEAGLVHFAVAATGSDTLHQAHHFGDLGRGPCRIECLRTALGMLKDALTNR